MRKLLFQAICCFAPGLLSGQVITAVAPLPNTVSATATLTRSATAGTAVFEVQVLDASLNANLDTAVSLVASVGASAANLSAANVSVSQGFVVSRFDFRIAVPVAEFTATRDKVIAAQRALANSNTQAIGWSVSYDLSEDDLAATLQQALPSLLERSRRRADALAAAIGRSIEKVVSVSTPAPFNNGLQVSVTLTATYSLQ